MPRIPPGCLDGCLPPHLCITQAVRGCAVYLLHGSVTGPRAAVRFGLPLMSGTPGAGLARKGVMPAAWSCLAPRRPGHFSPRLASALSTSASVVCSRPCRSREYKLYIANRKGSGIPTSDFPLSFAKLICSFLIFPGTDTKDGQLRIRRLCQLPSTVSSSPVGMVR